MQKAKLPCGSSSVPVSTCFRSQPLIGNDTHSQQVLSLRSPNSERVRTKPEFCLHMKVTSRKGKGSGI